MDNSLRFRAFVAVWFYTAETLITYHDFASEPGFTRVASQDKVATQGHSFSIPLYVKRMVNGA